MSLMYGRGRFAIEKESIKKRLKVHLEGEGG